MRTFRIALIVLFVALVVWVVARNTGFVTLSFTDSLKVDVFLPLLVLGSLLLGWLPPALRLAAARVAWKRRLARADARIATLEGELGAQLARAPAQVSASYTPPVPPPAAAVSASPIYVAVDTPDLARARALATAVRPHVGGLKLGLEFFARQGPDGVLAMAAFGLPIFLDLKLHDIPNTVASAVRTLNDVAPAILTLHAGGGEEMMAAAREAADPAVKLVAVTVLTSLDADELATLGIAASPLEHALRLARLAAGAGVDGVVCSALEVAAVRADWPEGLLVVPGVRPLGEAADDQKRVLTPAAARAAGADVLVIGRPITRADDPAEAARAIAAELLAA